jgi:hypothetical protein
MWFHLGEFIQYAIKKEHFLLHFISSTADILKLAR